MTDYELYHLLEVNGFETTKGNLNILKEGLANGSLVLNEDDQTDRNNKFSAEAEYVAKDDAVNGRGRKIAKTIARTALGAAIGGAAGLGAGAGIGKAAADNATEAIDDQIGEIEQQMKGFKNAGGNTEDQAYKDLQSQLDTLKEKKQTSETTGDAHTRLTTGMKYGTATGAVVGAAAAKGIGKARDKRDPKNKYRTYNDWKKTQKENDLTLTECARLLEANGFEPSYENIDILMENGVLVLFSDNIILTEDVAPEYALMKLLDANGFEPTLENVRVLSAGLDSGSILID